MSEYLFIRLSPDAADQVSWITTDAGGRRIGLTQSGQLTEAAGKAAQRKLVLIVPGTEIVHTHARVPVRSGSKLRQAVPYALEDQLADDVENLHFALGKRGSNDLIPVAVTARDNMRRWLALMENVGLRPQIIVSDSSCVPDTPDGYTVIVDGELIHVHGPEGLELVFEGMGLDQVLELSGVHMGETESVSKPINLYLTREAHDRNAELLEFLSGQLPGLNSRVMVDGSLAHLAAGMFAREATNLRQGEFAPRGSPEKLWKPWRWVAILAAAVLLVGLGGQGLELLMLRKQEQALDLKMRTVFEEVFPDVPLGGDPANQVRSLLSAMRSQAGNTDPVFLDALGALSEASQGDWNGRIESASFRNGVLDLKILVPSVEVLERIRQNMEQAGAFVVVLESANPSGQEVEGRIQLQRVGA